MGGGVWRGRLTHNRNRQPTSPTQHNCPTKLIILHGCICSVIAPMMRCREPVCTLLTLAQVHSSVRLLLSVDWGVASGCRGISARCGQAGQRGTAVAQTRGPEVLWPVATVVTATTATHCGRVDTSVLSRVVSPSHAHAPKSRGHGNRTRPPHGPVAPPREPRRASTQPASGFHTARLRHRGNQARPACA